ncbi:MAG: acetyl-CoA carboxylase carboxyltransferase subunit alpha [Lachnospiraceae bacterium]|nr:acetyl-CoA carboxylase carboxyltransferase subunit alpha [Lachnospiraceae bacterium]
MENNVNDNSIITNTEGKKELTAYDRVHLARDTKRPKVIDFITALFDEFVELKGDRLGKEDNAILGGIALFHNIPVTVIGHRKGKTLEENMACNFGMPGPEGYRKALRLMKQAEKFGRPIITFVDTPGAYPGIKAEENGQAIAIADSIAKMSTLKVPVITVITGEGSSGGALAISVANSIIMLENAVYSILSPEGFASILWKDSSKSAKACDLMKITARDLKNYELIDEIVSEPEGGMQANPFEVYDELDKILCKELKKYGKMTSDAIAKSRYHKFRKMDSIHGMVRKEAR